MPSIPSQQKGAVVENPGEEFQVRIRDDLPVSQPKAGEILVNITCSGLCGSEVRAVRNYGAYNRIIGHEGVGYVVKCGDQVSPDLLGKRVGIKWLYSACTQCSVCQRGLEHHCPKQLNTSKNVPGVFQEYAIADARFITIIPDGLSSEVAAPLLCAGLTMAGALSHLDPVLKPGDWVAISGSGGGLGHIGVQIAARVKKLRVIAIDTGADKEKLSLESSAEVFIDYRKEDVAARVLELTQEGADATIVVPGSKEAFEMAPSLVRNAGSIVCVGLPRNDIELPISATVCAARGLSIKGSSVGTEDEMSSILQLALQGVITPAIEVFDFAETPRLIEKLTKDGVRGRAVVTISERL